MGSNYPNRLLVTILKMDKAGEGHWIGHYVNGSNFGYPCARLSVTDGEGQLKEEVKEIIRICKEYDVLLCSGHIGPNAVSYTHLVGTNLMILLECRLDNVLFRMGLGRTRKETRQIVDHKHVLVNGKPVNIPSYRVKTGDVIEIKEKYKSAQRYKDILEVTGGRMVPAWLDVDQENLRGTVKEMPTRDEIDVPVNEMLIVELYSK